MDQQTRTIQRFIKATTYAAYARHREQLDRFNIFKGTFSTDVYYITTKKDQYALSIAIETSLELPQLYATIRVFRVNSKGSSYLSSSDKFCLCEPDSIDQFVSGVESAMARAITDIQAGILYRFDRCEVAY